MNEQLVAIILHHYLVALSEAIQFAIDDIDALDAGLEGELPSDIKRTAPGILNTEVEIYPFLNPFYDITQMIEADIKRLALLEK
jgi:hypothetical protein